MVARPCKVAAAQDHAGTCSHSHHPATLEEPREIAPTPRGSSETPPPRFLSASSPPSKLQPIISPPKLCPGFVGGTSAEVPLAAEPRATTWISPVVCVPPCPRRHSCQSRSHVSELTIPPDAGREKLNKTPRRDDIKKELSHHSWGS